VKIAHASSFQNATSPGGDRQRRKPFAPAPEKGVFQNKDSDDREVNMHQDQLEKRFGVIAVEKGFINADQLFEAMTIQLKENLDRGEHRLLGKILFDLGYMNPEQINEVLDEMGVAAILLKYNMNTMTEPYL
jgi:hypothetical protein